MTSDRCETCRSGDVHPVLPIGYACRRGGRCAERVTVVCPSGRCRWGRAGARITTYDGLCAACTRDVTSGIRGLALDYAELHTTLAAGIAAPDPDATPVSHTAAPPVPIALHKEALQRDIVEHTTRWAAILADTLNIPAPPVPLHAARRAAHILTTRAGIQLADLPLATRMRLVRRVRTEISQWRAHNRFDHGRPAVLLGRAVRLLSSAVPQLIALGPQPILVHRDNEVELMEVDGVTASLTLLDLHEQVRRVCGRAELVHHLPTLCPSCGVRALVRPNGAGTVSCGSCHAQWSEDRYEWFSRVATDVHRGAV